MLRPTVHTSPPSGVTGLADGEGMGIGTMPNSRSFFWFSVGSCHGPFTIIAAFPAMNWSLMSAWVQVTTDLEADLESTRSFHSVSAWTACGESSCLRLAPAVQKKGSNWKLPSSVPTAENAMPYRLPLVSFPAATVSSSQVFGGCRPASPNSFLL